jgi:iron(III) transport system substrate-binding protein
MNRRFSWLPIVFGITLAACGGSTTAPASSAAAPATSSPAAAAKPSTSAAASAAAKPAGSTAASAAAKPAGSAAAASGSDVLQQLYTAAKAEGQVTVVAPTNADVMNKMVEGFNARYPGIKVNVSNLTAGQTVERIVTEATANKTSLDVSQASLDTIRPLTDRNLLAKVDWPSITDGAPNDAILSGGLGVIYYQLPNVIAYNTKLLKADEAPKQWEDLVKPNLKGGKILVDNRGHFMDHLGFVWDQDRMLQFAKDLKAQQPLFIPRMSDGAQRMSAGEAPVATVSLTDYLLYQAKGAPLQLSSVSPINASNFVQYALKDAPHPNAAKLYVAWAVSKEGRALFEKTGNYAMATPGSGSKLSQQLQDAHVEVWSAKSADEAEQEGKNGEAIQKIFSS